MNSCLSTDLILQRIISKLKLNEKFGVQGVCRKWRNIAIQCLRHHEYLAISEIPPNSFWCGFTCDDHPSVVTVNNDNLLWGKRMDLEFWLRNLSLLQGVKYVYMDLITENGNNCFFRDYRPMLQLLIDCCGQSLECLCIPGHSDYQDETFPLTESLPSLKHMILGNTTSQVTKNILSACPNLEYLESSTTFTDWQMLPKRFKKLKIFFLRT